jgi:thermostable 8-oxoguanine DNA glycosylase
MIDPTKITKFNRTREELEELLLFCLIVAGKTAAIQARKLEEFLNTKPAKIIQFSPFELIEYFLSQKLLLKQLQRVKMGQYNRLEKAFKEVINLDVFNCNIQQLESIPGIGPKTARFYLLHSRPNQKIAVLDTHVLKWLREELKLEAPKSTPSSKKYLELEVAFLKYCQDNGKDPATFDLEIWNKYSSKTTIK